LRLYFEKPILELEQKIEDWNKKNYNPPPVSELLNLVTTNIINPINIALGESIDK